MKFTITTIAFLFICTFALAQSEQKPAPPPPVVTYRIDMVAKDSFYLIEIQTSAATEGNVRPQVTETPILFKGQGEWDKFLEKLREASTDDRKKAKDMAENASKRDVVTLKIEALMSHEIADKTPRKN